MSAAEPGAGTVVLVLGPVAYRLYPGTVTPVLQKAPAEMVGGSVAWRATCTRSTTTSTATARSPRCRWCGRCAMPATGRTRPGNRSARRGRADTSGMPSGMPVLSHDSRLGVNQGPENTMNQDLRVDGTPIAPEDVALFNSLRTRDRVTILVPGGLGRNGPEWREAAGRVVMITRGSHAVLDMGGKHGRPGVCDARNIVRVAGVRS